MMRPRLGALVWLSPFVLACATAAGAAEFTGEVVGVSDGDTLTVLHEHSPVKVRLHGIDAPESGQPFGSRAKQAASGLAFGRVVTVRPVARDRYGRTVAEVVLPDGRVLNHELVRGGCAWWYRVYAPADPTLRRLEAEARDARTGLWSGPTPIPPWDWRRGAGRPAVPAPGVLGNRASHVYHRPDCPGVARMAARNRVGFPDEESAAAAGYREGGDCRR